MRVRRHLHSHAAIALAVCLGMAGCDAGPQAIRYGQDECAQCKMTLVDRHYGAELITEKGKVFKFDDINCLLGFVQRDAGASDAQLFVIDFDRPGTFLPVAQAVFLQHDRLRTPMGSELAAFANETGLEAARNQLDGGGRILRWHEVLASP